MSGRPNTAGDEAVLAAITHAAEAEHPCPTNATLAAMLGARSHSTAASAIDRLARRGLIEIERFTNSRVVTIVATGLRTAGEPGIVHWRASNVPVGVDRQQKAGQAAVPAAKPEPLRVDRDPCTWCGIRADIGCKHNRALIAAPPSVHFQSHVAAQ